MQATLASLQHQTADPAAFDVVVVADGPTDDTVAVMATLAATPAWAGRLQCLEQPWSGAAAARNTGLQAARGGIVLFLDDDVRAAPELVVAHLAHHAAHPAGVVVLGRIVPEGGCGALAHALAAWWADHYRRLVRQAPSFTAFFTGNVSVPRAAALAAGGLDPAIAYGEDIEFGYRLSRQGLPFVYAPDAAVRTRNPKSARAILRDFSRQGAGAVAIYRKLPGTLPALPLAAYGETNARMRLVRGALLALTAVPGLAWLIDAGFGAWAASPLRRGERPLFELARSYYFWRGVRGAVDDDAEWARLASPGVPVLVYHRVAAGGDRYAVAPRRFARQMALLRRLGYRVVPLDTLVATWEAGQLPAPRTVALTFDDGYRDNLTQAWPVLGRFGYPATLFFVTGQAGGCNAWDQGTGRARVPLLTWEQVQRLDRAGFRAAPHTVTHPDLACLDPAAAAFELAESRRQLETQLGRPATLFAYPYGHHNPAVDAAVAAAGYRAAFSVRPGLNTLYTDRLDRRRVEIHRDDSLLQFALKVWAGDDLLRYLPRWPGRRRPAGEGAR